MPLCCIITKPHDTKVLCGFVVFGLSNLLFMRWVDTAYLDIGKAVFKRAIARLGEGLDAGFKGNNR